MITSDAFFFISFFFSMGFRQEQLCTQQGIEVASQVLVFQKQVLSNSHTLDHYAIGGSQGRHELTLLVQLHGGADMAPITLKVQ
jgi:hypothetical protein